MYPGLPTRLEKDIKDRYLNEILKGTFTFDVLLFEKCDVAEQCLPHYSLSLFAQ